MDIYMQRYKTFCLSLICCYCCCSITIMSNSLWPHVQAPLSSTISLSLLKFMYIEFIVLSSCLILCHSLVLLPSNFPSIQVFSNESAFCIMWPKYWSFNFNISPSNECSGLISFRINCFDLLRNFKSLLVMLIQSCPILLESYGLESVRLLSPLDFSRHEYWSGWPFPLPEGLPNPEIEPTSPASSALADKFFITEPPGKPPSLLQHHIRKHQFFHTQLSLWSNTYISTWLLEKP